MKGRKLLSASLLAAMMFALLLIATNPHTVQAGGPWYVDGASGSDDNDCLSWGTACQTIPQAVISSTNGDTIHVASGVYSVSDLLIANRTLIGAGADQTILDGNYAARVLQTSGWTYIYSLTIRHGLTSGGDDGGAIFNWSRLIIANSIIEENEGAGGGAIRSDDILIIRDTTLRNNVARSTGGAIYNRGTLVLENSTLTGNRAPTTGALHHAGFFQSGTAALTNTTVSSNTSSDGPGGIYAYTGTLILVNSTIVSNVRQSGIHGSGLYALNGAVTTTNTILANNSPQNCTDQSGVAIRSSGHNLDSDATCGLAASGDISNTNPLLGRLQDNGGRTWTHALLPGSPAINQGSNSSCPATDQRGIARPQFGPCDIGSYELEPTASVYLPVVLRTP
jgi:hypothetical protein